jgi:hypothetical protein
MKKSNAIFEFSFRTRRINLRLRLNLIVLLVMAAIAGNAWTRELILKSSNVVNLAKTIINR